jgi:hypothetical protein
LALEILYYSEIYRRVLEDISWLSQDTRVTTEFPLKNIIAGTEGKTDVTELLSCDDAPRNRQSMGGPAFPLTGVLVQTETSCQTLAETRLHCLKKYPAITTGSPDNVGLSENKENMRTEWEWGEVFKKTGGVPAGRGKT